jgi:hypothetical protein
VLLECLRPIVETPDILILVGHADSSLDGGFLAVCCFNRPSFPKCEGENV